MKIQVKIVIYTPNTWIYKEKIQRNSPVWIILRGYSKN